MKLTTLMNKIQSRNDNSMPHGQAPKMYARELDDNTHIIIAMIYDGKDRDSQIENVGAWAIKNQVIQEFRATLEDVFLLRSNISQSYQKFSRSFVNFDRMRINLEGEIPIVAIEFPLLQEYWNRTNMACREIGNISMQLQATGIPIPINDF